jgi:hypothetical protein
MVLLAKGSALVANSTIPKKEEWMITKKVEVVRCFYYQLKPLPVGTIIELPLNVATEVLAMGKAKIPVPVEEEIIPVHGIVVKSVRGMEDIPTKRRGGKGNAGKSSEGSNSHNVARTNISGGNG